MGPTLTALVAGGGEDLAPLAALTGPELVAEIRQATDDDLRALVRRDAAHDALLDAALVRLPEYAVLARLRAATGVVRVEVPGRARAFRLARGKVTAEDVGQVVPDVVLTCSTRLLLRILAGQANAGLEHVAGSLRIAGDTALALALGGAFRDPDGRRVDPRSLDPFVVADVVGRADATHLRTLMGSGFREVVLEELFAQLPEFLDRRKAHGVHLRIGLRLLGRPDGGIDQYLITVADGTALVTAYGVGHEPTDARDAVVTCQADEFLKLATGHLSAVAGVLRGRLKISGDKAAALRLSSILALPRTTTRVRGRAS